MKLLGRKVRISNVHVKIVELSQMIWKSRLFKHPLTLLRSYLYKKSPPGNSYQLKDGNTILLSSNPHDTLTVMVIFCREEYGKVNEGDVVLDIGANIGTFSLYAAINGAKRVFAFEPSPESYSILCKNIAANNLSHIITPLNFGVSDIDNKKIYIPATSSPYNKSQEISSDGMVEVNTLTLATILETVVKTDVNLCKIDCEGAEYSILFSTPSHYINKIKNVRMEHHVGHRKTELISWFFSKGYEMISDQNMILWFKKINA